MPLNRHSRNVTQPASQGAAQAILCGTGLTPEALDRPQVGVGTVWYDGSTCNQHLLDFATRVREAIARADMVGMRFVAAGVNDAIAMGKEAMRYSLPSRDLIADSMETVVCAHGYDALVAIPGCDKNLPGCLMAMARMNRPSVVVFGGHIAPGRLDGRDVDVISAFQAYGELVRGSIDEDRHRAIVRSASTHARRRAVRLAGRPGGPSSVPAISPGVMTSGGVNATARDSAASTSAPSSIRRARPPGTTTARRPKSPSGALSSSRRAPATRAGSPHPRNRRVNRSAIHAAYSAAGRPASRWPGTLTTPRQRRRRGRGVVA